ncbi:Cullin family-domain-containing protein [Myxozyma melibiosi]|uniref:Cullin family-domain-containing protein n=1 Tax=Myxozyma melibiosi TaxID=54550 RepID=A0ABR1FB68_9ASCO
MLSNFPSRGLPLSQNTSSSPLLSKSSSRLSSAQRPKRQKQLLGSSGPRKLTLASSTTDFFPNSDSLSEKYFNSTWLALNSALDNVFHDQPISDSFEALYRGVENLCRVDKSRSLWENLKMRMTNHIAFDFVKQSLEPAVKSSDSADMVKLVVDKWLKWTAQLKIVQNMFFYLDRSYLLSSPNDLSIIETGYSLFRKHIIIDGEIGEPFFASLMSYFELHRSHKLEDTKLIALAIDMIFKLDVYLANFHVRFLHSTRAHYHDLSEANIESMPIPDYLKLTMSALDFESDQATTFSFQSTTRVDTVAVVKEEMIKSKVDIIISRGFDDLVDAEDTQSLEYMYQLFTQVKESKALLTAFGEYTKREGLKLVMDPAKDAIMVASLLAFKAKLDRILAASFAKDDDFSNAMREGFADFINKRQSVPAEMIAKYVDELLRAGNKQMDDKELETRMWGVLILFRFIEGKDVFEAFYKRDLAKRLLLNRSASDDAERNMLTLLKDECGTSFTQKLEGMFRDTEISRDFMASFKNSKYSTAKETGIDLYVNALSQAFWPYYPDTTLVLPPEMNTALESFQQFYFSKQTGRKISWRHVLGHCVVKAQFPKGKKELSMSLFQTVVLLLFNDVDDGKSLTYEQIKTATDLDDKNLTRTLQSLACGKVRVLSKEPRGKNVNPGDKFAVNLKFEDKAYRLRINQVQLKETPEENKEVHEMVKRDREYEIQGVIVRIMKTKKTVKHVELIRQTIEMTKERGTLDLSDIKKNIEKLINKDYMERQGADTYVYLS